MAEGSASPKQRSGDLIVVPSPVFVAWLGVSVANAVAGGGMALCWASLRVPLGVGVALGQCACGVAATGLLVRAYRQQRQR